MLGRKGGGSCGLVRRAATTIQRLTLRVRSGEWSTTESMRSTPRLSRLVPMLWRTCCSTGSAGSYGSAWVWSWPSIEVNLCVSRQSDCRGGQYTIPDIRTWSATTAHRASRTPPQSHGARPRRPGPRGSASVSAAGPVTYFGLARRVDAPETGFQRRVDQVRGAFLLPSR